MARLAAFVAFLAVPLVEIYVLIQVGQVIGPWWTILGLVAISVLGAWLIRREWRGTWGALRTALSTGRLPDRELVDAGLVVIGGTLLLTPGFVTDLVGFFFLLPVTRSIARRALTSLVTRRVQVRAARWGPVSRPRADDRIIEGEVVDDDR
jgi:UPF0716 protein FxsA